MSKNPSKHLPDQQKSDFHRRLARGEAIDVAASKAGINDGQLIHDYVAEFFAAETADSHIEAEAVTTALSTLKEICSSGTDEDKVRCDAARALLAYVKGNKRTRQVARTETTINADIQGLNLWDFAE